MKKADRCSSCGPNTENLETNPISPPRASPSSPRTQPIPLWFLCRFSSECVGRAVLSARVREAGRGGRQPSPPCAPVLVVGRAVLCAPRSLGKPRRGSLAAEKPVTLAPAPTILSCLAITFPSQRRPASPFMLPAGGRGAARFCPTLPPLIKPQNATQLVTGHWRIASSRPRVARHELPWGQERRGRHNLEEAAVKYHALSRKTVATPSG